MYSNSAAVIRQDLSVFAEEASGADNYFIASKIMPVIESPVKAGVYPRIRMAGGQLLKAESTRRGPTGTYNEVDRKIETDTFDCVDRGLEERIDDVIARDFSRFFDVEVLTTKLITRQIMLDYEIRVAAAIMNTSTFNTTGLTTALTEANLGTMDIVADIFAAKERLTRRGLVPNTIIMTDSVFNRLRRSIKLQTFLYGTIGAGTGYRLINAQDIGNALGIPNVFIAAATYDSADKGQAPILKPVWGNDTIFIGYVAGGDFSAMGVGRTIVWTADAPGMFVTETYRSEPRRGDMVRVRMHSAEKIVDATAGEILTTGWA
jgi:hypothetical protein